MFFYLNLRLCFLTVFSVTLYEKLNELGEKKQSLIDEMEKENRGTPAEERERLLKQVNRVTDDSFSLLYPTCCCRALIREF